MKATKPGSWSRAEKSPACPFRADGKGIRGLVPSRANEIAQNLMYNDNSTFICHKDNGKHQKDQDHCAGALIMLDNLNRPNQFMIIAERINDYDRKKLDRTIPVYESFEAWMEEQQVRGA